LRITAQNVVILCDTDEEALVHLGTFSMSLKIQSFYRDTAHFYQLHKKSYNNAQLQC